MAKTIDYSLKYNAVVKVVGNVGVGVHIAGVFTQIISTMAKLCRSVITKCQTGVSVFQIVAGITGIVLAFTGVGAPATVLAIMLSTEVVGKVAERMCELGVRGAIKEFWNSMQEKFKNLWEKVKNLKITFEGFKKACWNVLTFIPKAIWKMLKSMFKTLKNIKTLASKAYHALANTTREKINHERCCLINKRLTRLFDEVLPH